MRQVIDGAKDKTPKKPLDRKDNRREEKVEEVKAPKKEVSNFGKSVESIIKKT